MEKRLIQYATIIAIIVALLHFWSIPTRLDEIETRLDTLETDVRANGESLARIERMQGQIMLP